LFQQLLLTDIDGTLLDNDGELPKTNLQALSECASSQVSIALATGRRWSTTKRLLDRLSLWPWVDFAIINNGMVIQDLRKKQTLFQASFPPTLVRDIAESLANLHMDPVLLSHANEEGECDVWYRTLSLLNHDFIEKNHNQAGTWNDHEQLRRLSVVEILLVGFQSDLLKAQTLLQAFPVETALIRNSFYREWMLEVTPKGFNKFSGASFLQSHLGLTLGRTMAVGDSANDLPLFRAAGQRVAMAEAPDELKSLATHIAASNHVGGMGLSVLDWLSNLKTMKPFFEGPA
jgi:5-amino-6-(5-phospho-D-ribitylamino)uracil phosphatase